jgi:hypothetical protein
MILEMLKGAHTKRCGEPIFGNHLRETVLALKEILHVRKCREIDCPRCPGLSR